MKVMQHLKIWDKLRQGELHTISKENVAEIFRVLDKGERGEITVEQLQAVRFIPDFDLSEEDIEALAKNADKGGSGKLSQEELYKAPTQGDLALNIFKKLKTKAPDIVDREILLEWLRGEYETTNH